MRLKKKIDRDKVDKKVIRRKRKNKILIKKRKVKDRGDQDLEVEEVNLQGIYFLIVERKKIISKSIDQEEIKSIQVLIQKVEKEMFQMTLNKFKN